MNKRRNFLIMSSVMLLVPGITTLYHLMKKIVVNGENRTAGLSNSIWLPNWRMQKSLVSALNALQKECVKTVSPFWYEINNRGILIAKPGSDGLYIPDKATIDLLKKKRCFSDSCYHNHVDAGGFYPDIFSTVSTATSGRGNPAGSDD
ncbi:TPA: hypothetical protein ACIVLE_004070 [Salmonella enterica subsp. enterica serovar Welikade]